jgi:hypothetical protein
MRSLLVSFQQTQSRSLTRTPLTDLLVYHSAIIIGVFFHNITSLMYTTPYEDVKLCTLLHSYDGHESHSISTSVLSSPFNCHRDLELNNSNMFEI